MMRKTLVIGGYGPGVGDAVARRFGREGFQLALVSRRLARVEAAASRFQEEGIVAKGFACDLGDPVAIVSLMAAIRSAFGPITALHWNAFAYGGGDLLSAKPEELASIWSLGAVGLLAGVRASLDDMRQQSGDSALLITGGGLATEQANGFAVQGQMAGLALCKSIHHKLAGMLHEQLKPEGVYVGEVMIAGMVKSEQNPSGTIEPTDVAECFFSAYQAREQAVSVVS